MRSANVTNLIMALSKVQEELPFIMLVEDCDYSNYEKILLDLRTRLKKHGLVFSQQNVFTYNEVPRLRTSIIHESQEWIEKEIELNPEQKDQLFQRLNFLLGLIGVMIVRDDKSNATPSPLVTPKVAALPEKISQDQLDHLEHELADYPELAANILTKWKLSKLADMPKEWFLKAIDKIREIKLQRKG